MDTYVTRSLGRSLQLRGVDRSSAKVALREHLSHTGNASFGLQDWSAACARWALPAGWASANMSALPSARVDALSLDERLLPIVVDLDGTLTPTDTLAESLWLLLRRAPAGLLPVMFSLLHGRAMFKEAVAARVQLDATTLPYRDELVGYLRQERAKGRRIVLATAAHVSVANAVADHLGLFDAVIATERGRNLKGQQKLAACRVLVGPAFVYAGDSRADIPMWQAARAAIPVAVDRATARWLRQAVPIEREFANAHSLLFDWLQALRVHHWLKNLLVFVPLLTSFRLIEVAALGTALVAFAAFSLVASATYIANDLLDLASDRAHPRKRSRPFAAARLPIAGGAVAASLLVTAGLGLAATLGAAFFNMLLLYLALTSAYNLALKRLAMLDVVVLSLLYTLRILAGSVAIGVSTSSWLLAFSAFIFFSLALAKRCAELITFGQRGLPRLVGRAYGLADLGTLQSMGVAAAMSAVVVFGLYVQAPETQARFASPQLLWLVASALVYWLGRVWLETAAGRMSDDPLVYAIRDRASLITMLVIVATSLVAHFFDFGGLR